MGKDQPLGNLLPGTGVVAAGLENGRALLGVVDAFVQNQSPFDRQARVGIPGSALEVTRDIYLAYVRSQVMRWDKAELKALKKIVATLRDRFRAMQFSLPATIYLVKTTGQEEGFAAYTRATDTIVLPANMVASLAVGASYGDPLHPGPSADYLTDILNHEVFHLISKNNPPLRDRLYGLVNYRRLDAPVPLPDDEWRDGLTMAELGITNPDTPRLDVCIEMKVPVPGGAERLPLAPVLLSSGAYAGGSFFRMLQWWFMAIEPDGDGGWRARRDGGGKPLMYDSKGLMEQYYRLIGRNITGENFHPDEILAQSFVLVSKEPSMALLLSIGKAMAK